jgi:lipopolysaccharide assembly outer membrane protein LptD (OstA)
MCLLLTAEARAQQPPARPQAPAPAPAGGVNEPFNVEADQTEIQEGHKIDCGNTVYELQGGVKFFADCIDYVKDTHQIIAKGNVVFTNPEGRIAAETVEFNTETGLGTFHEANGLMSLGPKADKKQFGNQDPDVYFWGKTIQKLGPRKYHITEGGFTTCVQPTPRWDLRTGNVTLNLNDYAFARNTVLQVKGVPIFYFPFVYYPIQDSDRATGFLLPTYGTSTLRGQAISNAFFWAIDRSEDLTFFHDWFTKTGQGFGTEYRYVANAQSYGNVRYYLLDQHSSQYTNDNVVTTLPATKSFELTGNATHILTPRWRARGRVDYVSDILTQQLYHQNVARSSNPMRSVDGNLSGAFRAVNINASVQWTEVFNSVVGGEEQSQQYGGTPRILTTVAPRQIFGMPIYAGLNSDYAYQPYRTINNGVVTVDNSLHRFDISPTARIPLSKLTFLTMNNSVTYRNTYYSRSYDPTGSACAGGGVCAVDQPLDRQYIQLRSQVIGPVLTKIWDTPESSRTQRMKHVIEPTFTVDYFTNIANFQATPYNTDPSDKIIGGLAQLTYGLNNRLFYRSRPAEGEAGRSSTREFLTLGVQQTYYTKPLAATTDTQYTTAASTPASFSPVALTARFSPSTLVDANSRIEYDTSGQGLQLLSLGSSLSLGGNTSNLTFSRTHIGASLSSFMSGSTSMAFRQNRLRGTYALSWDIERGYLVSQRTSASYLAQCCGFEVDFQKYNYTILSGAPIPSDRRLNFSFILAGLGTFSNFFGAFGGGQR